MATRILSPLIHDGIAYAPGDIVDAGLFSPAQTEHLVSSGTLVWVDDAIPGADEGQGSSGAPAETPSPASPSRKGKA